MKTEFYVTKKRIDELFLPKGKDPFLRGLDIELTERCNNNCIHCYINVPADDLTAVSRELTTEEIKNILIEAVSLGCLTVRFTGGEPFLREDFEELYIFARKLGLKVLLFTNATLITPHLIELFAKIPPLEKIEITIYGIKKCSYESVTRNSGSFESVWHSIDLLFKKKIPFIVKNALLPPNKHEMEDFESLASRIPWMDKSPSYSMLFDCRGRRDAEEKNRLIKSFRHSTDEALKIIIRNKYQYFKEMKEFCSKFIGPKGDTLFSCGAGIWRGCVDAYGGFQLCMLLRHPDAVYNLKNGSLKDALTNFFPKMRKMKAVNPDYLSRCAKCFLKGLCEQCPAKSWMEYGTLDVPVEYLCEIAHSQARFLGLVRDNENAWEVEDWKGRIKEFCGKGD